MAGVAFLHVLRGQHVSFQDGTYEILLSGGLGTVLCRNLETGDTALLKIEDLKLPSPVLDQAEQTSLFDDPEDLAEAKRRLLIIEPLLKKSDRTESNIAARCAQFRVSRSTIMRWIRRYQHDERLSGLFRRPFRGKGRHRLMPDIELLIDASIEEHFLTHQRHKEQATVDLVEDRCRIAGLPAPSPSTVRRRIAELSQRERIKRRGRKKMIRDEYTARGGIFDEAKCPLAIVEIDHHLLDIVVVSDDADRQPLRRPWITAAIDVYSRVVTGFYIALGAPDSSAIGMCILHSVLPKGDYLREIGVAGNWPVWGFPTLIHTDNGKDFVGKMLCRAADEYNIHLTRRPIHDPHFGAHIERFFGTLKQTVQSLPGTTFSNPSERAEYNSKREARLTLAELEQQVANFIVNIYHNETHRSLSTSPLKQYERGIHGDGEHLGIGTPALPVDPERVRMDFLPFYERKIEPYGVAIDSVHYYHDVLRPFVGLKNSHGRRESYIFRRDPKDISVIHFYDPSAKRYWPIPYRDITNAPMTAAELHRRKALLRKQAKEDRNERAIFDARQFQREKLAESLSKTVLARRRRKPIAATDMSSGADPTDTGELEQPDFESIEPFPTLGSDRV